VYHSNRGTGLSRNAGLLASCGLFVTFLDSDDEYLPDHLATRREILHSYPEVDLLHGGTEIVGNPYVPDKNDTSRTIHLSECVIGGTFVVRRDRALALGGYGTMRYADDTDFFERAHNAGYVIGETDAATYRYHRDTPDSLCNTVMREL
jgi:glycosyltransferase involved in cell wall biosynthesis